MLKWLMVVVYVGLGPWLVRANCPDPKLADTLTVGALLAGLLVSRVHLRQTDRKGYLAVAMGALAGLAVGAGAWLMGLLALAFASDDGRHSGLILKLSIVWTVAFVTAAAPLGATLGSAVAAAFTARRAV